MWRIALKVMSGLWTGVGLAIVLFTSIFVPSTTGQPSASLIPIPALWGAIAMAIMGGVFLATPLRRFSPFIFGMAGGLLLWEFVLARIVPLIRLLGIGG